MVIKRGADCVRIVQLMPLLSQNVASFKSGLVLSFWYQLTQVVLEKNRCSGGGGGGGDGGSGSGSGSGSSCFTKML